MSTCYADTESWNGTNWTEVNDLNTARYYAAGAYGDQYCRFMFWWSTDQPGGSTVANTESWNGTNWTEVNDLNTATRQAFSGFGTTSASAFAVG